jgi:hypothetical protein
MAHRSLAGALVMLYILVFIQYIPSATLKYYQIGPSYSTFEECETERRKAKEGLIVHNSQTVACLEVSGK